MCFRQSVNGNHKLHQLGNWLTLRPLESYDYPNHAQILLLSTACTMPSYEQNDKALAAQPKPWFLHCNLETWAEPATLLLAVCPDPHGLSMAEPPLVALPEP